MRPIKFRAWDKTKKRFWHDFRIHPLGMVFPANSMTTATKIGYWEYDVEYPQEQLVLQQFTGLTDKNGVEIYEGDIIGRDSHKLGGGVAQVNYWKFEVKWHQTAAGWDVMVDEQGMPEMVKYWKVIGNVFENPGLLEAPTSDQSVEGQEGALP